MGLKQGGARGSLRNISTGVDAIPDSVVAQYYGTTWTQGDAIWQDDAGIDGAQDISLTGGPQSVTLSDGAEALAFDGVDDYGIHTVPLSGSELNSWTWEFAVSWSHSQDEEAYSLIDSVNNQLIQFRLNIDGSFASDAGNFLFRVRDLDGNQLSAEIDEAASLNDGNRHNITIRVNDASADDVDIITDGTSRPVASAFAESPSNFGSWNDSIPVGAVNNAGTIQDYADIDIGAVRWHQSAISQPTISDYS